MTIVLKTQQPAPQVLWHFELWLGCRCLYESRVPYACPFEAQAAGQRVAAIVENLPIQIN